MEYNAAADIARLKSTLKTAVARELDQFRKTTGLTPSALSATFTEITTHGDASPNFVLEGIQIHFTF